MQGYALNKIANIVDGELKGHLDQPDIFQISIDSRKILNPDYTLFVALSGGNTDGHKFIASAYNKGVRQFLVQDINVEHYPNALFLFVKDPLEGLKKLAAYHRAEFDLPVIGITGSNGKTIVKEWLYQLLEPEYNVCRSPKSYNSQLGVPLSVMLLEQHHTMGIFEAGISTINEMGNLNKIIQPTIGIFTNIGPAHHSGFEDYRQKVHEKMKLFVGCEKLIFSSDHEEIEDQIPENITAISWGEKKGSTYQILNKKVTNNQTQIDLQAPQGMLSFLLPFADSAYIENCLHCIVMLLELGFRIDKIQDRISTLKLLPMRLSLKYGRNDCTIIDDSYSADLLSLKAALEFFRQQESSKKRTLIISAFDQSGMDDQQLINELIRLIKINKFQKVIAVGKLFLENINELSRLKVELHCFQNTEALLTQLDGIGFNNEVILIKGARQYQFERVTYRLQGQSHRTVLEIDLNALSDNFSVFKSFLKKGTGIIPMVKAFSYGSGSTEIATILEEKGVEYFAVAYVDEGVRLRRGGITTNILVMNPSVNDFEKMVKNRLEPEIYEISMLKNLHDYLQNNGCVGHYPIHIKVETGMNRLGFQASALDELITELKNQDLTKVSTISSHLAASDEPSMDDFTREQLERFEQLSSRITHSLDYAIKRHILNSSGIVRFPAYQYDYVRLGIGLYGIDSSHVIQEKLTIIGTLKTTVSQIKYIEVGETIGYGRKGKIDHAVKIAIIAIGYADGFDRRFSNGVGEVYIKGQKAKVVGNVCMDMCMVDITHIADVAEGDEVEVYGGNISIIQAADKIGTIPYELLTKISRRVRRVYYWN